MLALDRLSSFGRLNSISCQLEPNKIYALIGPNGAGKTSLLKTISGVLPLSAGRVLFGGQDLGELSRRERSRLITLIPQNPKPQFPFTVRELVEMGRYPHEGGWAVEEALEKTHLQELQHSRVTEISCGQLQQAYIARSLATEARVLLLDEPTAHLDLAHRRLFWKLAHSIASEGKILLCPLHHLDEAAEKCSEGLLLKGGRLLFQGPIREALSQERLSHAFGLREIA